MNVVDWSAASFFLTLFCVILALAEWFDMDLRDIGVLSGSACKPPEDPFKGLGHCFWLDRSLGLSQAPPRNGQNGT